MESITLPKREYLNLQREIKLLRDNEFLKKVTELIDILFDEKYSLYMGDFTDDLTEYSIDNLEERNVAVSGWDHV